MTRFSRQDVVRILRLNGRDLRSWERANLVQSRSEYSIREMGELRTLRELRARRIPARTIRSAMDSMQRMFGTRGSLAEVSLAGSGARLRFRHAGALVEPVTQQMEFDFLEGGSAQAPLLLTGGGGSAAARRSVELNELFLQCVRLEEMGPGEEAIAGYLSLLEREPLHAPTLINLGTIMYNRREFGRAEELYRRATEADPKYALAWFDLGNVLDEMGQLRQATEAYVRAVALLPHYADAHYNLALAYERQGHKRRALQHWLRYVRLDPVGPWNAHARSQARRTLKAEKLLIVSRRGRLVQAG